MTEKYVVATVNGVEILLEHLEYLDELRETGVTNMLGAGTWLRSEWPGMNRQQSTTILQYWMHTYADRHKKEEKK